MKLLYEKVDAKHFITLGYDTYCKSYIAHQTDGANDWYYKISEELYLLFDTDRITVFYTDGICTDIILQSEFEGGSIYDQGTNY